MKCIALSDLHGYLPEDIISLIHCFAMKMCSKRRKNKLKMIKENLEVEL